jgi:hypothetical protein
MAVNDANQDAPEETPDQKEQREGLEKAHALNQERKEKAKRGRAAEEWKANLLRDDGTPEQREQADTATFRREQAESLRKEATAPPPLETRQARVAEREREVADERRERLGQPESRLAPPQLSPAAQAGQPGASGPQALPPLSGAQVGGGGQENSAALLQQILQELRQMNAAIANLNLGVV